ncbi:S8 family serine peptidase [Mesonia mobilis]|uniref:S8 family serine peptidase n=2 Tax=Mesonia mobilis TaxID=369791 RepID=UPI0026EA7BB8|nr:S8 family serine peptidase [Mesonia mobilis]
MKKILTYYIFALIIFSFNISLKAQNSQSNKLELKAKIEKKEKIEKEKIDLYLKRNNLSKKNYQKDGSLIELVGFHFDGTPKYYTTDNLNAARSTRTNFLHPEGGLGLNLQGENMLIGIWDGGTILQNHNEFTDGLFSYRSIIGETSPNQISDDAHATHVAGTMVAYGVVNNAKGMAPRANIVSYNWTNDLSEVLDEVDEGLLISNHSYGTPIFSDNGQLPAYIPGKYTNDSRAWDQIANNYPYYLMVVSAGNEGNLSYEGSIIPNRDKLVGNKVSKNNLVVANAQDAQVNLTTGELISVAIETSSSQGPTDDGRIKPDIAGNGYNVYSSINTSPSSYATLTGTSMASPNVAGTLLLLQEYYNNINNSYMRAATLKGLACHTADDAGSIGPDIIFGWGLLNAKKAAETIEESGTTSLVEERVLQPFQPYSFNVQASGNEALKISISWNDPAGNASNSTINNPQPRLINDLDIRVSDGDETFLPYKLNPNNFNGNAIKADNNIDNIELIEVENPVNNGLYTVTITHKGLLESPQDYSIIATGITASNLNVANNEMNSEINVWPNPANNFINITSEKSDISDYNINLYDLQGRVVMKDISSETVNISSLSKGLYILDFRNGNQSFQKKIIKE